MKVYGIAGLIAGTVIAGGAFLFWFFPKNAADSRPMPVTEIPVSRSTSLAAAAPTAPAVSVLPAGPGDKAAAIDPAANAGMDKETARQVAAARLQELYGDRIDHPRIQLQAIEKLLGYLRRIYPEKWPDHVHEYLAAAFPDQAEALYDVYLRFTDFKQWVKDNLSLLRSMKPDEQKDFLWSGRKRFFGEEAAVIWEMELKAEMVTDSLAELSRQQEASFDEKLDTYQQTLEAVYGDQAEAYQTAYRQKVMGQFLELDSVQADLRAMNDPERAEKLDRFRTRLGLDAAARQRWAELDRRRDRRWEKGRAYMQERQAVLREAGGAGREERLDALRQSYFGSEAEIIKQEEQAGMFRFERKQVYGKN